ncbi:trans-sialidase, putative, partial [Trypanosoma cruzi]
MEGRVPRRECKSDEWREKGSQWIDVPRIMGGVACWRHGADCAVLLCEQRV